MSLNSSGPWWAQARVCALVWPRGAAICEFIAIKWLWLKSVHSITWIDIQIFEIQISLYIFIYWSGHSSSAWEEWEVFLTARAAETPVFHLLPFSAFLILLCDWNCQHIERGYCHWHEPSSGFTFFISVLIRVYQLYLEHPVLSCFVVGTVILLSVHLFAN